MLELPFLNYFDNQIMDLNQYLARSRRTHALCMVCERNKARADKLQEIAICHGKFDPTQSLVEHGVNYRTDENECLLHFTVKTKCRNTVKERSVLGACAESKQLMKNLDYATCATVKKFSQPLKNIVQHLSNQMLDSLHYILARK